ncbi:MAG: Uma2 family endonuclease [Bryobacteraceae bacterium]
MAPVVLSSVNEYLTTVYEPDCAYIDGEIVDRNWGEADHAGLQGLLVAWFASRRREFGIHVFPEMRVQVSPTRFRVPNITVTTRKIRGRILTEPPFLCIEILSPEDRASRLEDKIDDYLKFGVPHIWVLEPRTKRAWSYTAGGKREATTLLATASDPRIEVPIADLFRDLDEEVELP